MSELETDVNDVFREQKGELSDADLRELECRIHDERNRRQTDNSDHPDHPSNDGQIELTGRQRRRLDQAQAECATDGSPEPSDQSMLSGLLDTWDAVKDGLYSGVQRGKQAKLAIGRFEVRLIVSRDGDST